MLHAVVLAFVLFLDGQSVALEFDSAARCESFAAAIAPYVESVDCETILEPIGVSPY